MGAPPQQTKNIFDSTGDSIGAFTQRCRWPSAGAPASREPSAVHHRSNSCVKLNGTDEAEDASQKALDHGLESSPWCPCAPASSTSQTCCRRTWRPACCTPSSSPSRSCTPASRPWRHHKTKARLTSPCYDLLQDFYHQTSGRSSIGYRRNTCTLYLFSGSISSTFLISSSASSRSTSSMYACALLYRALTLVLSSSKT